MKIEQIKTSDLIPYARNSRSHSEAQVAQIAGSIREFGFTNPVLIDADNGIIAGHGRVMAAGKLGLDKVPCIRLAHLTETQKRAYIIADNKLALNAGWDDEMLGLEMADLREADFDLDLTGFDGDEIEAALNPDGPDFQPGTEEDQGKLDEKNPIECPHCHKFFTT
jgi:ParB-like chromosome segregation protein Spo0J